MTTPRHPVLADVFRCSDQSALLHNYVVSEDPAPGAWSHHSAPQSPLGRIGFPEVLNVPRGEVYTRAGDGQLTEHMLLRHEWLPWLYTGSGTEVAVERTMGPNAWAGTVRLAAGGKGLLLLECVPNSALDSAMEHDGDTLRWRWNDYTVELSFLGSDIELTLSDDPAQLKRRFAGFDDVQLNPGHMQWVLQYMKRLWAGVVFNDEIEVRFTVRHGDASAPAHPSFDAMVRDEEGRWTKFFEEQVPPLPSADPVWRDTYYFAWLMLWSNRCAGGTWQLPHPYTSPARLSYGSQWWWDSVFHAAVFGHLNDPAIAYGELANFWPAQGESGVIPGCLHFTWTPEKAGHSDLTTQPPVIGLILQLFRDRPGWPQDLRGLYEPLVRYAEWFHTPARDSDGDGLSEWFHCFETSIDQSPRWDSQKLDGAKTIDALRPTTAIDLNVWLSELWRVLGAMAAQLGLSHAATAHEARARDIFERIDTLLWHEGDGIYYDIDAASRQHIRIKTVADFMPLLSPYIKPERASRLVHEHLLNPAEFWCEFPVPSVALDEPTFNPIDMWRGPSWINMNWMVVEGLRRNGFTAEAAELTARTIALVGSHYDGEQRLRSPRLWEWYQPQTGEALGNTQYSWSALVIDLMLRDTPVKLP